MKSIQEAAAVVQTNDGNDLVYGNSPGDDEKLSDLLMIQMWGVREITL